MKKHIINIKFLSSVFLILIALIVGLNTPSANAVISTNYTVDSPRVAGVTPTGEVSARIRTVRSMSGDGRYVVFSSEANNMVSDDTNGVFDVFVRDIKNGSTTRVSVSSNEDEANNASDHASISYDGRYVVFDSTSTNLVPEVTSATNSHVYMRDLIEGTTVVVDSTTAGGVSNGSGSWAKVSAEGRFVVFQAYSTNLAAGISSPTKQQVYIKDMHTGSAKALSVTSGGVVGNQNSSLPDISCDGNVVVFTTDATNLKSSGASYSRSELMLAHLGWSGVELSDVTPDYGVNANTFSSPQISCDGNIALFVTSATNVVSPATPSGYTNAYEYNRLTRNVVQVSLGNGNVQTNTPTAGQYLDVSMSGNGRYVAFSTLATNMDTNPVGTPGTFTDGNVYVRDVQESTTEMATVLPSGAPSRGAIGPLSISGDGTRVAFLHYTPKSTSYTSTLIPGYTTGASSNRIDVYSVGTGK